MHEVGIMQSALGMAIAEATRVGATQIHKLRLRIGTLSGVVPEALELAFAAAVPGTPAERAELIVESVPVICQCELCGHHFEPEDIVYLCPICGEISSRVQQGRELELASLEVS